MITRHFNIRTLIFFVFVVSFALNTSAQFSAEYYLYKEKYPNAHFVRLNQETNLVLKLKKGELDITRKVIEEDIYLDESASHNPKRSLDFSSFFELEGIHASSFVFDRDKYEELKVDEFTESDRMDRSFHDDSKSVSYVYSNLREGSKSKMEYTEKIKDPRFLTSFYFANFYPVVNSKFIITADKDIHLNFVKFNLDSLPVKFSEEEKWGKKIYTWEVENVDEYAYEEDAPSYKDIFPHVIPILTSYETDGGTVRVLNDVEDLYGWYYSLTKDLNKEAPDAELVELVHQLVKDKANDLEKVKAIYYWVQQNIKYIDFEYELGGFIPREANKVFQQKYGDCKDNSSILEEMLSIAGLQGNLTWVGTRSIPYKYNQVPTPIVDNHMILTYTNNGTTYFLDATGRYLPIDFPSGFIQGKEVLIGKGKNSYEIANVPVIPAEKNTIKEVANVHLKGNTIVGQSHVEFSGYFNIDLFNYLENHKKESEIKELYKSLLEKGNNKFSIDELKETNKFDYEKNLLIDYSFSVEDYIKELGDEIYVNLNLNRDISNFKTKKDRKIAVENDFKKAYNYQTNFVIPEGYTVEYLPVDTSLSNDYISAKISYSQNGNQIIYNHQFSINFLTLDVTQLKEVNQLIEKIEKAYREVVILKKIKP